MIKRVLIVEDNWMMAHMIEEVAIQAGLDVVGVASSWEEAEKVIGLKPHFAVLDININGAIDGLGVARKLKEQGVDFLFLTAYKDLMTIKEATELSPLAYLIKPITPENLMATFLVVLNKLTVDCPTSPITPYSVDKEGLIYKDKTLMSLSKSERRALGLFIRHLGHAVSYDQLFYGEDGKDDSDNEATLRNVVAKLRKKCPDLEIKNIKDVGYIASPKNGDAN